MSTTLVAAIAAGTPTATALAAGGGTPSGGAPGSPPPPATPVLPRPSKGSPLAGRGMWIWVVSQSSRGNLSSIVATARTYGLQTLMIKSGDGTQSWSQFNPQLVAVLHAQGLKACAWQYVYGAHPIFEAEVGAAAVHDGADCLLIDAESEYEGRYVQAQQYVKKLRQLIGPRFPVALASFPYVDYHPSFPYSVFLGPGAAQYNVPQMYWRDIGTTVDNVYSHTYAFNSPYGRPIEPLGEIAGNPPFGQIIRFRQVSRAYGSTGVSWWDWQEASARGWQALAQAAGNLVGFSPLATMPTLTVRSQGGVWAGDLVVWAQEHLYKAGFTVSIDGRFGSQTQAAVLSFQTSQGLPLTGAVDPQTWAGLLRYPPASVSWVRRRGKTVAVTARRALLLSAPASAHLPAARYEIPRDLGAGHP